MKTKLLGQDWMPLQCFTVQAFIFAITASMLPCLAEGADSIVTVFGPVTVQRNVSTPTEVIFPITIPPRVVGPFSLRVENGADGAPLVSSARVTIDGNAVLGPSDFSKRVTLIEREVALNATATLAVRLASTPGAQLRLSITGVRKGPEEVTVTSPGSYVTDGVTLDIGVGALMPEEAVTIGVEFKDDLPGAVDATSGVVQASRVLALTKNSTFNFQQPIQVTMPYDTTRLRENDIPWVFYWDDTYRMYRAVAVRNVDRAKHTISFVTVHFTDFVALAIQGLTDAIVATSDLADVDTGFRPSVDGFFHPNFGSYTAPGGSCIGMANYALWYFNTKKAEKGKGLFELYRQGDQNAWDDDTNVRELIARAFAGASQIWPAMIQLAENITDLALLPTSDVGLGLITAMKITKSPQTLLMSHFETTVSPPFVKVDDGHAVTVYRYDSGRFFIYDNNVPNEEATIDWSWVPTGGFSNYSKADLYPSEFNFFGFEAPSTVMKEQDFESLFKGVEEGWPASLFATFGISEPVLDAMNVAVVSSASTGLSIKGTISGGSNPNPPRYLTYSLEGGICFPPIDLRGLNSFDVFLPSLPDPTATTVTFVATDEPANPWSNYQGFKQIVLKVGGAAFFANLGFEDGSFGGWTSARTSWYDYEAPVIPSDKSAIVSSGNDPIDPSLPLTYSGSHSARINNADPGYHISTVSQTAVIPNTANPEFGFRWAAVLEDPQHPPEAQPYVDVRVTDESDGTVLYSKHFYSNDPAFSGWRSVLGGGWKTIGWQPVKILNLANRIGHRVKIEVTAADCGYGGHGGYAYLDSEE